MQTIFTHEFAHSEKAGELQQAPRLCLSTPATYHQVTPPLSRNGFVPIPALLRLPGSGSVVETAGWTDVAVLRQIGCGAMKLLEITVRPDRITIRREAEERLTSSQKCAIILSVIGCVAFLGFFALMTGAFR